jgi:ABC-type transport system involved in cytochrome c biogenesis permease subunit
MYYLLAAVTFYAFALMGGRAFKLSVPTGLLVHAVYIVQRTILLGHLPVTERLDILSLMSFLLMLLLLITRKPSDTVEYFVVPMASFFAFMSILQEEVNTVDIFMHSPWFYLYSSFLILGYVLLGMGTAYGLSYLKAGEERLEEQEHDYILIGWLMLAVALMFGSIWFFLAYGSYWYWTAREFWLSMVWTYYGGVYLHSRYLTRFSGRPSALLGVLGYPLMLFNYFGIGTIIQSPWSQF